MGQVYPCKAPSMIRWALLGVFALAVPLACGSEARDFGTAGAGNAGGGGAVLGGGGRIGAGAGSSGTADSAQAGAAGGIGSDGSLDEGGAASVGEAGATGNPARCDPTKKFAAPVLVAGVNAADDYGSSDDGQRSLSIDGLNMFLWRGAPVPVLLTATRASADDPFSVPAQDPNLADATTFLAQSQLISAPSFSADGLTLYAGYGGESSFMIYMATRLSPTVNSALLSTPAS